MEGEWSCYRSGRFNGGGQFKGAIMVMLQRWPEGE